MTAKATTTPIIASMNRIDRATKKALRDRERRERATTRRDSSPQAAARYDALIEALSRAHCVKYERLDWNEIAGKGLVEPAVRANARELAARRALANYRPGLIDTLFGLETEKRRALAERVLEAARADAALYAKARLAADTHNLDVTVAPGVMALDPSAIESALKAHLPVELLQSLTEGVGFHMPAADKLVVYVEALEFDSLPDEVCFLNEAGRAAYVPMPYAQRSELHLASTCSAALRVGVEVMQVVPVDKIDVLVRCPLLNSSTGGLESRPVLHVRLLHDALARMDLRRLEPVSTVTAFGGRLDWEIARGFGPIAVGDLRLTQPDLTPAQIAAQRQAQQQAQAAAERPAPPPRAPAAAPPVRAA